MSVVSVKLRPRLIVAASQRNGSPGGAPRAPQLFGKLLKLHERLETLFDRAFETAPDERAIQARLVGRDDRVERRRRFVAHALTRSRSSGTTQSGGRPACTRRMLSKALRKAFGQFSHVGPAVCGVMVHVSTLSSGWSLAGGSSTITSRPAPAMRLVMSALCSARSSTTGPRQVLTRIAVGFISSNWVSDIMFCVTFVSGVCNVTTSEVFSSSSNRT